ncbi:hypothetical protein AXF42_Ash018018 [Apostasia shenzhenica]|uniref:Autophagy-related protein 13 N-terminal domain-containing protein n=1 Tax=Apostasia shenzhenica TaxID=1088818 RepID=A0A2I0AVI7_9ASPA|nr:hypothetical protein AXF42_Ash018018 [Apostasia shenzhenica]
MAFQQSGSEQIISQFFIKTLQSILASRIPHLARSPDQASAAAAATRGGRRDRWFNLALGEFAAAAESPGLWNHGVVEPMILDVILSPLDGSEQDAIVERWSVQCEAPLPSAAVPLSPGRGGSGGGEGSSSSLSRRTYKKCIVLLRSIYSLLRYLPAYRVFRLLRSSNQPYNYEMSYRVSSFAEHFSREDEKGFELHGFTPVETHFGHLSVSVLYRPTLSDFNLEVSSLHPPLIITDYVGSPAAEPMRDFPSSPCETRHVSFPQCGVHSPAAPAFQRRHSWAHVPMAHHPLSSSPDAVLDHRASPPDYFFRKNITVPSQSRHRKSYFSFDEFRLSPPCSQSPCPSPPTHTANTVRTRLQLEPAPVSIPQPLVVKNQLLRTPNFPDPTRSLLLLPLQRNIRADACLEESHSRRRSLRKSEALKMVDLHSKLYSIEVSKDAKDESRQFSGVLSSVASPRFFYPRSSSHKLVLDDHEDYEFSCAFAVDDVDIPESQNWIHDGKEILEFASTNASPRASQDAAVGALVHMLRTAAPLCRDHSYPSQSSKPNNTPEICKPTLFESRKVSNALEELRRFRKIKEILLSKSRRKLQSE